MNELLDAAYEAASLGLTLMPVNAGGAYDKRPHLVLMDTGHLAPSKRRKGQFVPSWKALMTTPPTLEMLGVWFARPQGKGLACITGQPSKRVVIDLDGDTGDLLRRKWGVQPHVRTGSGGWHIHAQTPAWPVPTLNGKSKMDLGLSFPGLDSRGDGGYAILPPTRSNAGRYTLQRPLADLEGVDFLPARAQILLGLLHPPVAPLPAAPALTPMSITEGQNQDVADCISRALDMVAAGAGRDNSGFWLACAVRNAGWSVEEAKALAFYTRVPDVNTKGQREPYTRQHWETSVDSAFKRTAQGKRTQRASQPTPLIDELRLLWPVLTPDERVLAAAHVAGSWLREEDGEARLNRYFGDLGLSSSALALAVQSVQQQYAAGASPSGITRLATRYFGEWRKRAKG
ncbi:hypothetical protein Dxin01_00762 [Deinococcus xinjiangensis]|uniref:DNA primase/polymerase bifunctional N-terminal domain-containing protein n=1 Tax=Deinococcus xinjiangensis TaxID=457454 RepID=A0ABP9V735_9DEIO